MSRLELKNAAKEQIQGKIGTLFIIMLVMMAILLVCCFIPVVGSIAMFIITPAF